MGVGAVTVTILTLLGSVSLALGRCGDRRAFWMGFAVCGVGYLAMVTTPFAPELVVKLATTQSIAFLRDTFHPPSDFQATSGFGGGGGAFQIISQTPPNSAAWGDQSAPVPLLTSQQHSLLGQNSMVVSPISDDYQATAENFLLIGQCVWAWLLAALGGTLSRFAARRTTHSQCTS